MIMFAFSQKYYPYLDEYEHYMVKLAETNPNNKYGLEYFTNQFNQPIIVQYGYDVVYHLGICLLSFHLMQTTP